LVGIATGTFTLSVGCPTGSATVGVVPALAWLPPGKVTDELPGVASPIALDCFFDAVR